METEDRVLSDEQVERLWKWCGLRRDGNFWYDPEGKQLSEETPPMDLNNLFLFAVPKLYPNKLSKLELVALVNNAICDSIEQKIEVSLALALAILMVIGLEVYEEEQNRQAYEGDMRRDEADYMVRYHQG